MSRGWAWGTLSEILSLSQQLVFEMGFIRTVDELQCH